MRYQFLIIIFLWLPGCASFWLPPPTQEEIAIMEKERAEAEAREEQERTSAIIARYTPFCSQLGFKNQTPEFADCILRLHVDDEAKERNRRARIADAFREFSNQMQQNRSIHTQCFGSGNYINCTSR